MEEEKSKKEKKTVGEWLNEHPKTVFITRAIAWAAFAGVLPFVFIAYRYGIFRDNSAIALSGWGFIGVIIAGVVVLTIFNYLRKGLNEGIVKQCIMGFVTVIVPLLGLLMIVKGIASNIELFEKALGVTIACELVAIPINPFPEWLEKRRQEKNLKEQESIFGALWDKFFNKKKEYEDKGKE